MCRDSIRDYKSSGLSVCVYSKSPFIPLILFHQTVCCATKMTFVSECVCALISPRPRQELSLVTLFWLRIFRSMIRFSWNTILCVQQNIYTVSFSKPGYMELGGLLLAVGTEISLSFSTLADTGTIFLAVGGASPISQQVWFHFFFSPLLSSVTQTFFFFHQKCRLGVCRSFYSLMCSVLKISLPQARNIINLNSKRSRRQSGEVGETLGPP